MKLIDRFRLFTIYQQAGSTRISLEQYRQVLNKAIKFSEDGTIIQQNKNLLIDIPDKTINHLLQFDISYINSDQFKQTFKQSKHWNNIKNTNFQKVFFARFDFNDPDQIDLYHYKCFQIKDQNELELGRNQFIQKCSHTFGFYTKVLDINIICLNSLCKDSYGLLYHQLSHFIQDISGIRIIGTAPKRINKLENQFGIITANQVLQYFSPKQFIPSQNDLFLQLEKVKKQYYNDKSIFQFLDQIKSFIKRNKKSFNINDQFVNQYLKVNQDFYPLSMLIASYNMNYKFQKIWKDLEFYFQSKF